MTDAMSQRAFLLVGVLLMAGWPGGAQAQTRSPSRSNEGRFELALFGTFGPEHVLDKGDVATDSVGTRLGYFAGRSLQVGVGFERVVRRGASTDHTLQLIEPFLFYHIAPRSALAPYFGIEGEQRLDLGAGAFGFGLVAGARIRTWGDTRLFLEGRLQLQSYPGYRVPLGGGVSVLF